MILCPACRGPTRVLETRASGRGVRRERICTTCSTKATTIEVVTQSAEHTKAILRATPKPRRDEKPR